MLRWRCGPNQGARLALWANVCCPGNCQQADKGEREKRRRSGGYGLVPAFRCRYIVEKVMRAPTRTRTYAKGRIKPFQSTSNMAQACWPLCRPCDHRLSGWGKRELRASGCRRLPSSLGRRLDCSPVRAAVHGEGGKMESCISCRALLATEGLTAAGDEMGSQRREVATVASAIPRLAVRGRGFCRDFFGSFVVVVLKVPLLESRCVVPFPAVRDTRRFRCVPCNTTYNYVQRTGHTDHAVQALYVLKHGGGAVLGNAMCAQPTPS